MRFYVYAEIKRWSLQKKLNLIQEEAADSILDRKGKTILPRIVTEIFPSVIEWDYRKTRLEGYDADPAMKIEIAV